ncbi:phage major capsid protein [Corynebacterium sp. USCH3]|uniref:phage major capsid protein n=1 Tax=Corynebacterium sp. USCH3 TaxID=3024840 RepID=UPI0030A3B8D4
MVYDTTKTPDGLVPKSLSAEIWKTAMAEAVVPTLAKSTPIIIGENTVPTLEKRPSAHIVGESEAKSDSDIKLGETKLHTAKVQTGLEFTMEVTQSNPGHVMDMLAEELSGAISRQIDLAVLHGRVASTGEAMSGDRAHLSQTSNEVAIGTDLSEIDERLWDGYAKVVANDGSMTGAAIDPKLTALIAQARDKRGNRIYPDVSMSGTNFGPFASLNTGMSKTISGRVDASTDTGIVAFAGDFEALRFGRALDIPLKRIEYGDPFGNGDLQRHNRVAFMVEAIVGWGVMDANRFVKYTVGSSSGGDGNGGAEGNE